MYCNPIIRNKKIREKTSIILAPVFLSPIYLFSKLNLKDYFINNKSMGIAGETCNILKPIKSGLKMKGN